ncbi:hypothetical protein MGAST_05335 [Mycobacterium gastri 'Wayne']|nr:hypothetical protein MGAST_05335 [Mycobacterium gastri 'Wayne']
MTGKNWSPLKLANSMFGCAVFRAGREQADGH